MILRFNSFLIHHQSFQESSGCRKAWVGFLRVINTCFSLCKQMGWTSKAYIKSRRTPSHLILIETQTGMSNYTILNCTKVIYRFRQRLLLINYHRLLFLRIADLRSLFLRIMNGLRCLFPFNRHILNIFADILRIIFGALASILERLNGKVNDRYLQR